MLFERLRTSPIDLLSLGAQSHALLLMGAEGQARKALEKADWTCHECGTRLPEGMDVDHGGPHVTGATPGMKPICAFCHDLHHPLWSAARHRIAVIHAPDLSQADISRMAWAFLALAGAGQGDSLDGIRDALRKRQTLASGILGTSHVEAIFEGFRLYASRCPQASRTAGHLDARLRFVPSFLVDPGRAPMRWTREGFQPVSPGDVAKRLGIAEGAIPDLDRLGRRISERILASNAA